MFRQSMGAPLKIVFEPGDHGWGISAESGLVSYVARGGKAHRLGVCVGMRILTIGGRRYTENALDAAIASNMCHEIAFAVEDKMNSHVLFSSSTEKAMATISRHPNGVGLRVVEGSRSLTSGSASSSLRSWADMTDEAPMSSWLDQPQSDGELAIPTERKSQQSQHVVYGGADHLTQQQPTARSEFGGANSEIGKRFTPVPVQHMWWYEDDSDPNSSSVGDGPSYISDDGCEGQKGTASKSKTGAQTVAGSGPAGFDNKQKKQNWCTICSTGVRRSENRFSNLG